MGEKNTVEKPFEFTTSNGFRCNAQEIDYFNEKKNEVEQITNSPVKSAKELLTYFIENKNPIIKENDLFESIQLACIENGIEVPEGGEVTASNVVEFIRIIKSNYDYFKKRFEELKNENAQLEKNVAIGENQRIIDFTTEEINLIDVIIENRNSEYTRKGFTDKNEDISSLLKLCLGNANIFKG